LSPAPSRTFRDTSLEPDLDDNEDRQRKSQEKQDGSEVRSVELERLIAQGQTILERRSAFEHMRDLAAERYEAETGSAWRPRAGSLVNHRHMTAAMIDSRDFIAARRRTDAELLLPKDPKIAFSGGADYTDHKLIWAVLDKAHAKHPDMVLIHGGSQPTGHRESRRLLGPSSQGDADRFQPRLGRRRQGRAVSSATTACSTSCPRASSSSPALASPAISPTRPSASASPFSITGRAARKRRFRSHRPNALTRRSSTEGREAIRATPSARSPKRCRD
jgi:hypothetical protein